MRIPFFKFHGTGNDFILIEGIELTGALPTAKISQLCDRHYGIGADGLIILSPEDGFDFRMTYYNSDGNEGSMCGNGGRCALAFYAMKYGTDNLHFIASDGEHNGTVSTTGNRNTWHVQLSLGDVTSVMEAGDGSYFLDTGSPHHIEFIRGLGSIDIIKHGRHIRYEERYAPDGTNVNFVESEQNGVNCRTYERGVEDETLSCGTGVTAVALAAHLKNGIPPPVRVNTKGGLLEVEFDHFEGGFSNIRLSGNATYVFSGTTNL